LGWSSKRTLKSVAAHFERKKEALEERLDISKQSDVSLRIRERRSAVPGGVTKKGPQEIRKKRARDWLRHQEGTSKKQKAYRRKGKSGGWDSVGLEDSHAAKKSQER